MTWPINSEADAALKADAWRSVLRKWPETLEPGVWAGENWEKRFSNSLSFLNQGFHKIFKDYSGWAEARKGALAEANWRTRKTIEFEWNYAAEEKALSGYRNLWWDYVRQSFEQVEEIINSSSPSDWAKLVHGAWQPLALLPITGAAEFSPSRAEDLCTEFMLFMGAEGAVTTRGSKDSGLDIVADKFVAQVKHLHSKVGVKALREFLGASISTKKIPIFFSRNGFTDDAVKFAIENEILAFEYVGHFSARTPQSAIYSQLGFLKKIDFEAWMSVWPGLSPYDPFIEDNDIETNNLRTLRKNRFG